MNFITIAILRTLIIFCFVFGVIYLAAQAMEYGSAKGVFMAMGSLAALGITFFLYRKLRESEEEMETGA